MALEDKDIFAAIFAKHSNQPIEFVMAEYEKAKLLSTWRSRNVSWNSLSL